MNHEYADDLCLHCGLPPRHADPKECPVNKYGEPAKRALEAVGLKYVGFELNGMYALYPDPLSVGSCERMFWPQITAINGMLDLLVEFASPCSIDRKYCLAHSEKCPCPHARVNEFLAKIKGGEK